VQTVLLFACEILVFRIYERVNDIANCQESILMLLKKVVAGGSQDMKSPYRA